jgi:hypothetical protein
VQYYLFSENVIKKLYSTTNNKIRINEIEKKIQRFSKVLINTEV